ncbi:MAG: GntR family transcriptional regulator [Thermoflexaceae bacterium]|nr:GntR family transcriptional regulator [Thermoflexaceae bacterium]
MFQIDVMSRTPVYEQLVDQVEKFILTGILSEGDKIPSVRSLSMELSVNPNTIQKAFSELDRRGLINSVPGKGCFVSDKAKKALQVSRRGNLEGLSDQIRELALAGISKEEIISCVEKVFGEEDKK